MRAHEGCIAQWSFSVDADSESECPSKARMPESIDFAANVAICVILTGVMTHMKKTQVYLPEAEHDALLRISKETGRSLAALVREAVRDRWLRDPVPGPVAIWDGEVGKTSVEHDSIYDAVES